MQGDYICDGNTRFVITIMTNLLNGRWQTIGNLVEDGHELIEIMLFSTFKGLEIIQTISFIQKVLNSL